MYNKKSYEDTLKHFSFKKEQFERALQMTREEVTDDYIKEVQQERVATQKSLEELRKNKEMGDQLKEHTPSIEIVDQFSTVSTPTETTGTTETTSLDKKQAPQASKKGIYASIVED